MSNSTDFEPKTAPEAFLQQEIESLRAKVTQLEAALAAERKKMKRLIAVGGTNELHQKLAAAQLEIQRLRGVVAVLIEALAWAHGQLEYLSDGSKFKLIDNALAAGQKAISTPTDTAAQENKNE